MALEHRFLQLLELPTSAASSTVFLTKKIHENLFPGGTIHGVVSPDLPEIHPLFRILQGRDPDDRKQAIERRVIGATSKFEMKGQLENRVQESRCWRVQTVASQLRSRQEIATLLVNSAHSVIGSSCGGSLLLVSGGHPMRRLPYVETFLPANSLHMLKTASKLRSSGDIPAGVQIWAVENPLANPVERLEQKVHAGAETVILQPPLLVDQFETWWSAARSRGLMKSARVVVGLPLITSVGNLAFWFELTQTSGKQADARLAQLREIEASLCGDKSALTSYYKRLEEFTSCQLLRLAGDNLQHFRRNRVLQSAEIILYLKHRQGSEGMISRKSKTMELRTINYQELTLFLLYCLPAPKIGAPCFSRDKLSCQLITALEAEIPTSDHMLSLKTFKGSQFLLATVDSAGAQRTSYDTHLNRFCKSTEKRIVLHQYIPPSKRSQIVCVGSVLVTLDQGFSIFFDCGAGASVSMVAVLLNRNYSRARNTSKTIQKI